MFSTEAGIFGALALALIMLIVLVWLHHSEALQKKLTYRREIAAFDIIRSALGRGAETGKAIHLSPGAGTIGNRATTAETLVGLLTLERVAIEAARNGAPILVSSGDAVTHLALRGIMRQVYQTSGQAQDYDAARVQLLAHEDTTAYAAGVATLYARQKLEASHLVGSFGQDFLLTSEEGAQQRLPQLAGSTSNEAIPVMLLSTNGTLIGEEIFAAEAYLSDEPASQARLRTQDVLRLIVIVALVLVFVYSVVQSFTGFLPALPS